MPSPEIIQALMPALSSWGFPSMFMLVVLWFVRPLIRDHLAAQATMAKSNEAASGHLGGLVRRLEEACEVGQHDHADIALGIHDGRAENNNAHRALAEALAQVQRELAALTLTAERVRASLERLAHDPVLTTVAERVIPPAPLP